MWVYAGGPMSEFVGFRPKPRGHHLEYRPDEADEELEEQHVDEKDLTKWRKRHKSLQTKPIFTHQFPTLLSAMYADGLVCVLTDDGYQWFHGRYPVTNVAIRNSWTLSSRQWDRMMRYVYIHGTEW